jgi:hypothetical protein
MIGYDRFSSLRLRRIFPPDVLQAARFYFEAPDKGPDDFDDEYMGGSWASEIIDGVTLWLPKRRGSQVGIVHLQGGPYPDATAVRDRPQPFTGPFLEPTWTANANRMLGALDLPFHIGDGEESLQPMAAASTRRAEMSDSARRFVSFAIRSPDLYHAHAIVHDREGLLSVEIRRPDLIRINEYDKGGYELCFGGMFDEGAQVGV